MIDEKTEQDDMRLMGFTRMDGNGFVIYDAFRSPLLIADNTDWPPKVIEVFDSNGNKTEYIPKQ